MAEIGPAAPDPGGRLELADRVGQRLIRVTALTIPGVEQHRSTFSTITGSGYPKADVDMAQRRPAVHTEVAIRWPTPVFDTAQQVQEQVRAELERLTGARPKRVDVVVSDVLPAIARRVDNDDESRAAADDSTATQPLDDAAGAAGRARGVRATPGAALPAAVFAVCLLALAAIALHDLVIGWDWASGDQWFAAAARWLGRLSWQSWMLPAAIAAVVVGLWLAWLTVAPRRRTHLALAGQTRWAAEYLRPQDLAMHCGAIARDIEGVESARATATFRKVTVRLKTDPRGDAERATTELRHRLSDELAAFVREPKLLVKSSPYREE